MFEQRADGVHLVGEPPRELVLTKAFLMEHSDHWTLGGGDVITFWAVNGERRYRIVEWEPAVRAELIERSGTRQEGLIDVEG